MATATYVARPMRMTDATFVRRRLGVLVFAAALASSVGVAAHDGLADRGGDPASAAAVSRSTTYVVQPGDTLWAVAERMNRGGDLTLYVDALITLNGGSVILPGQQLRLP
jgi:LysM repeat protein